MQALFDEGAFIALPQDNELAGKQCKTCKHIVRHYFEGRWIYTSCGIRHVGRRNYRVKATQQACKSYKEENL